MGYALAYGLCFGCNQMFAFNPVRVPSIRVTGTKEPVCRGCMVLVNQRREKMGLEAFVIHSDAYEPCDEGELG